MDEEVNIVMDNIEEYVNEVEGNVVGQEKKIWSSWAFEEIAFFS